MAHKKRQKSLKGHSKQQPGSSKPVAQKTLISSSTTSLTGRTKKQNQRGSPRRIKAQNEGFRSAFEYDTAQHLDAKGIHWEYESVTIDWQPRPKKYVPDFHLENGIFIECKGKFDADDRAKHLSVREQHPELDIRLLFQNAYNKLRKGAKMTYAEWCDHHGIQWAHKYVPEEWLK